MTAVHSTYIGRLIYRQNTHRQLSTACTRTQTTLVRAIKAESSTQRALSLVEAIKSIHDTTLFKTFLCHESAKALHNDPTIRSADTTGRKRGKQEARSNMNTE